MKIFFLSLLFSLICANLTQAQWVSVYPTNATAEFTESRLYAGQRVWVSYSSCWDLIDVLDVEVRRTAPTAPDADGPQRFKVGVQFAKAYGTEGPQWPISPDPGTVEWSHIMWIHPDDGVSLGESFEIRVPFIGICVPGQMPTEWVWQIEMPREPINDYSNIVMYWMRPVVLRETDFNSFAQETYQFTPTFGTATWVFGNTEGRPDPTPPPGGGQDD